jgi:hypothetical protein
MRITPIDHGLDLAHSYGKRGKGVHISDLYGAYYAALHPKRYAKKSDSAPRERWGLGMAFEEMLEEGLANRVFNENTHEEITRPGEFQTEHTIKCKRLKKERTYGCGCACGGGILYSPDLLIFNGGTRSGEIKLHSMSHKGAPHKMGKEYTGLDSKFDKYFSQISYYNYHLGITSSRLYFFSVREMVYFNEPSIFLAWNIEFSQRELAEEWDALHRFAVQARLLKGA